jgi:hypothetical protein
MELTSCRLIGLLFDRKIETVLSPETSVHFYQTTRRHIPEDYNCRSNLGEKLNSNILYV